MADQNSIEPSYEMMRDIIKGFGFIYEVNIISLILYFTYYLYRLNSTPLFEFQKEKTNIKSKYAQNPKSMLQYEYESVYFVCRKPRIDEDDS